MGQKLKEKAALLLSKEKGTVYKDPGGRVSIALVYPNTYHVGMSNLGFQGIYGLLNGMNDGERAIGRTEGCSQGAQL